MSDSVRRTAIRLVVGEKEIRLQRVGMIFFFDPCVSRKITVPDSPRED